MAKERVFGFARKYGVGLGLIALLIGLASAWPMQRGTTSSSIEPVVVAKIPTIGTSKEMAEPLPLDVENVEIEKYVKKYTEGTGRLTTVRGHERARSKKATAEPMYSTPW